MHVLIYEPVYWGGHNLSYVRHLVRTLAHWPVRITVVTGENGAESEGFTTHLKSYLSEAGELKACVPLPGAGTDWGKHFYHSLVDSIDDLSPDHVFVPTGDDLAAYAGSRYLRGSLRLARSQPEIECNVLSAFYQSSVPRSQKLRRLRTSLYASYAPWTRSFTIDPFVSVGAPRWRWLHRLTPEILPDPVEIGAETTRAHAREVLGLPQDDLLIGCVGHFESSDRKNPVGLIQGFLKSGLTNSRVTLIGKMSQAVLDFVDTLREERQRVVIINRLLTQAEIQLSVSALDLVCLPYRDFYQPSAIALNAAVLGRPVLASDTGWFKSIIPLFDLGWTADLSTPDRIASALRRHCSQLEAFRPSEQSKDLAAFSRWENYAAIFCRRVRRRLGVETAAAEITWESVARKARRRAS